MSPLIMPIRNACDHHHRHHLLLDHQRRSGDDDESAVVFTGNDNHGFDGDRKSLDDDVTQLLPVTEEPKSACGDDVTAARQASDADVCFPRRHKPVFPYVEIAISDVVDKNGCPVERRFDIADAGEFAVVV